MFLLTTGWCGRIGRRRSRSSPTPEEARRECRLRAAFRRAPARVPDPEAPAGAYCLAFYEMGTGTSLPAAIELNENVLRYLMLARERCRRPAELAAAETRPTSTSAPPPTMPRRPVARRTKATAPTRPATRMDRDEGVRRRLREGRLIMGSMRRPPAPPISDFCDDPVLDYKDTENPGASSRARQILSASAPATAPSARSSSSRPSSAPDTWPSCRSSADPGKDPT